MKTDTFHFLEYSVLLCNASASILPCCRNVTFLGGFVAAKL